MLIATTFCADSQLTWSQCFDVWSALTPHSEACHKQQVPGPTVEQGSFRATIQPYHCQSNVSKTKSFMSCIQYAAQVIISKVICLMFLSYMSDSIICVLFYYAVWKYIVSRVIEMERAVQSNSKIQYDHVELFIHAHWEFNPDAEIFHDKWTWCCSFKQLIHFVLYLMRSESYSILSG